VARGSAARHPRPPGCINKYIHAHVRTHRHTTSKKKGGGGGPGLLKHRLLGARLQCTGRCECMWERVSACVLVCTHTRVLASERDGRGRESERERAGERARDRRSAWAQMAHPPSVTLCLPQPQACHSSHRNARTRRRRLASPPLSPAASTRYIAADMLFVCPRTYTQTDADRHRDR